MSRAGRLACGLGAFILGFTGPASPIPAGAQEPDASIRARHLAGNVHLIEGAIDLIGVSAGPDGLLMVDGGYMETAAGVRMALEGLGSGRPVILVDTHWHHAFANEAFDEDAVIIGHASLPERLLRTNSMAGREIPPWQVGAERGFPPGDLSPWMLTPADAEAAAEAAVPVISTILREPNRPRLPEFEAIHRHNLGLFRRHEVPIAVGSDGAPGGAVAEARYLGRLGDLGSREVLDLLSVATPRAIFPERRIGALEEGYEASFLVLEGDPLADPENLGRIRMRVKQGIPLR